MTGCVCNIRRREHLVGVNMVLAEFVKFKHGLYKSCGLIWFEGIVLEPCLLQLCFHVAGTRGLSWAAADSVFILWSR